jgi:Trypsin-like peptidase domain
VRRQLLSILILIVSCVRAAAGCIDPATLAHSTVSITRHFDDKEREANPDVLGIRGTGWFLSPMSIATAEHVAAAMQLSDQNWKQVEIRKGETKHSIPARIRRLAGSSAHKVAVVELQTAFSGAQGFRLRMESLVPDEPIVSLAYPGGDLLRVAGGRFVQYGDGGRLAGTALLEMYDGNDRLVLDHGSSGAPVFDCTGRVVAVVDNLFTTTMQFMSRTIRISTAWGYPNVVSVPVPVLKDFSQVE